MDRIIDKLVSHHSLRSCTKHASLLLYCREIKGTKGFDGREGQLVTTEGWGDELRKKWGMMKKLGDKALTCSLSLDTCPACQTYKHATNCEYCEFHFYFVEMNIKHKEAFFLSLLMSKNITQRILNIIVYMTASEFGVCDCFANMQEKSSHAKLILYFHC